MSDTFSEADRKYMTRALALARRGQGAVEPNPMVGAVVVHHGKIIGEGYHHRFGSLHAEIHALLAAGKKARGATLYVTLEPCCHWGKTPPCTDAILHVGIRRVVVAMVDPFAKVRGNGIEILRAKGLRVDVGLLEHEARRLNAPFITRQTLGRPYVIAKWAQSLDGCIATASGESKWISSEISRAFVHKIRGRVDAVIVGISTALADDPLLTARPKNSRDFYRTATRIVIDSDCRLPVTSQLIRTIPDAPLLVAHSRALNTAAERRRQKLTAKGAMTLPLPADASGNLRLPALLYHLAALEYANILVEGGPKLLASFFHLNLVDEAHVFLAPTIIGGSKSRHAVGGPDLKSLAAAHRLQFTSTTLSGPDLHLLLHRPA